MRAVLTLLLASATIVASPHSLADMRREIENVAAFARL
jgi:hypothetical protein